MEQVNHRRGEDLRFVGHDRTLRIHHLRVNCDSNLIVAYISYMHMASPSSEIPVSFRLVCDHVLWGPIPICHPERSEASGHGRKNSRRIRSTYRSVARSFADAQDDRIGTRAQETWRTLRLGCWRDSVADSGRRGSPRFVTIPALALAGRTGYNTRAKARRVGKGNHDRENAYFKLHTSNFTLDASHPDQTGILHLHRSIIQSHFLLHWSGRTPGRLRESQYHASVGHQAHRVAGQAERRHYG